MSIMGFGQRLEITRACLERGLEANDHMLEMMQRRIQEALAAREAEIFAAIMVPIDGTQPMSLTSFFVGDAKPSREARFDALRAEGKKLGEINDILEAEGYSEVFGEGVMPCPTKHHAIVRENKGARKLIESLPGGVT